VHISAFVDKHNHHIDEPFFARYEQGGH
jgi:hypothetical protein